MALCVLCQTDFRARSVVRDEKDQRGNPRETGSPQPTHISKTEAAVRRQPVYRPSKGFGYTLLAKR